MDTKCRIFEKFPAFSLLIKFIFLSLSCGYNNKFFEAINSALTGLQHIKMNYQLDCRPERDEWQHKSRIIPKTVTF